ncbi:serine acetyltransferase [Heyndrickxia sporothermodurans]|uniref:serine acetyltransferase n=1 Tax=Heyndrickxia sporothermodurans TaxID=46224 RepID=UPI002E211DD7|nr:serine acetyltransferase [Heyndrickxia sporothermodurans]MED3697931.1 serine acetyltransferase [Heyndrickxia sporothermodurans]
MFIKNKKDLKEFLTYESRRYGKRKTSIPLICIGEKDYLWKYNALLRRTEYCVNTGKKFMGLFYRFWLSNYQNKHKIHIPINTFDKGLKLMHLGSFLVNKDVRAGKDITLHVNTSLVAGGTNDYCPVLGDGLVIGVGAVILGKVKIANHIAVGANALVNKSFDEENIAIAGVPAKKVSANGSLNWNAKVKKV